MLRKFEKYSKSLFEVSLFCFVLYLLYTVITVYPGSSKTKSAQKLLEEDAKRRGILPTEKPDEWVYEGSSFPEIWYQIPTSSNPECRSKQNVYFLRTHQTGTSSVSNIFYRYGQEHKLNFVMYPLKQHLNYPNILKLVYLENLKPKGGYNILAQYTRHRQNDILRIMPDGTIFTTLLRSPVDQFLSVFNNFDLKSQIRNLRPHHDPYEEFFRNPEKIAKMSSDAVFHLIQNSMSFDLGLEPKSFKNPSAVDEFIAKIDKEFHLVMILELLDESLILLKRLMCWSLKDVIYVKLSINNEYGDGLSADITSKIREWNAVDQKLYDHFYNKLKATIAQQDDEFSQEVAQLKKFNREFSTECYERVTPVYNGNKIGYTLRETHETNRTCKILATDDITQNHAIGLKQFRDKLSPSDVMMVRNHLQNLRKHNPAMLGWSDINNLIEDIPDKNVKTEL